MIRPKNKTEHFLLSTYKNCEKPIKQTHRKAEETLEIKINKPRETFHFKPPISNEGSWMVGLTSLEVYNSIFNITEQNNKFDLCKDSFDEVSFAKLKVADEEIVNVSDLSPEVLKGDVLGPFIISIFRKLQLEKSSTDGYAFLQWLMLDLHFEILKVILELQMI